MNNNTSNEELLKTLSDRSEKYVELMQKILSWSMKLSGSERVEFLNYFKEETFELK